MTYQVRVKALIESGTLLMISGRGSIGPGRPTGPQTGSVTVAAPLVGTDQYIYVPYEREYSGTLDADGGFDSLTFIVATNPTKGVVNIAADGSFTFTANPGSTGPDVFSFLVSDSRNPNQTSTAEVTVEIGLPVTTTDTTLDVPFEGSGSGAVSASGGEGDLSYSLQDVPAKGTVQVSPDGTFDYTAGTGQTGADSFTVLASDTSAPTMSDLATVSVAIGEPGALVATSMTVGVDSGGTATGSLAGQISGGIPPYTFAIVSDPSLGTLDLSSDGNFIYVGNAGESGTDTFSYSVTDGQLTPIAAATSTGTVSIVIAAPPPSPTPSPTQESTATPPEVPGETPTSSPTATIDPPVTVIPDTSPSPKATSGPPTSLPSTGAGGGGSSMAVAWLFVAGLVMLVSAAVVHHKIFSRARIHFPRDW